MKCGAFYERIDTFYEWKLLEPGLVLLKRQTPRIGFVRGMHDACLVRQNGSLVLVAFMLFLDNWQTYGIIILMH